MEILIIPLFKQYLIKIKIILILYVLILFIIIINIYLKDSALNLTKYKIIIEPVINSYNVFTCFCVKEDG